MVIRTKSVGIASSNRRRMNFNIAVPTRLVLHIALKKVLAARNAPPLFLVFY